MNIDKKGFSEREINTIIEMLDSMKFGQIVISVQNGKIVMIEKTEKYKPQEM